MAGSVAQIVGPLLAAQSLAFGATRGFDGLAFITAGALIGTAALIIAFAVPKLRYLDDTDTTAQGGETPDV